MSSRTSQPQGAGSDASRDLRIFIAIVFLLAVVNGCGNEQWQAATYPATGKITINGRPPEGAVVTFQPTAGKVDRRGSVPWAIVDETGSFVLSTYEKGDGAPAGDYLVTIRWPLDVTDMSAALTDRLGGAYASAEVSRWKVTIGEGPNEIDSIAVEGAKIASLRVARAQGQRLPTLGARNR